ncbi:hypothetical protein CRUP_031252 [Coryphaenoides rupestris]|nr:hypothetical protein CRUP_031252 [Coryphaenoides rupestris]
MCRAESILKRRVRKASSLLNGAVLLLLPPRHRGHSTWEPEENILDDRLLLGFEQNRVKPPQQQQSHRNVKHMARAQKGEVAGGGDGRQRKSSRRAAPARTPLPPAAASSSTSTCMTPTPKNSALASTHKLKKDIHRCHRMSRRPLPRAPPASSFPTPGGFPPRPHASTFSETVRILNRRVKPREVKRGRIIVNLKVIDKPGRGGGGGRGSLSSRQNLPSRNRIIGKRHGEAAPYRPFQPPLKMLGLPMYGKPFGLQCGGPRPFHPQSGTGAGGAPRDSCSRPPAPPAGSRGCKSAAQSQPGPATPTATATPAAGPPSSSAPQAPACFQPRAGQPDSGEPPTESRTTEPSAATASPSSLPGDEEPSVAPDRQASPRPDGPAEPPRVPMKGDPDWRPDTCAPRCKGVVVTDVTTNLVTVTIKEFPSPAPPPSSSSTTASPDTGSAPPAVAAAAATDEPAPPKP